jgi:hypothetical protein
MTPDLKIVEPAMLAEAVRQVCIEAALAAYEDAHMNGLCHEGAWECAVDAMQSLNLASIVAGKSLSESGKENWK